MLIFLDALKKLALASLNLQETKRESNANSCRRLHKRMLAYFAAAVLLLSY